MVTLGVAAIAVVVVGVMRARDGAGWRRWVESALLLGALVAIGLAMRAQRSAADAGSKTRWSCERIAGLVERTPAAPPVRRESRFGGVMTAAGLAVRSCVADDAACEPLIARAETGDVEALRALARAMRGERGCEP